MTMTSTMTSYHILFGEEHNEMLDALVIAHGFKTRADYLRYKIRSEYLEWKSKQTAELSPVAEEPEEEFEEDAAELSPVAEEPEEDSAYWEAEGEKDSLLLFDGPHAPLLFEEIRPLEEECGELAKEDGAFGHSYDAWKPLVARARVLLVRLYQELTDQYEGEYLAEEIERFYNHQYPQLTTDCDKRAFYLLQECRSAYVSLVFRE